VANNLTRDEARDRRQLLEVISYQVELDLTGGAETFGSATVVRFRCATPGAASFIELTAPAVREMVLNGRPVPASAFDGDRIQLAGLAAENELRVVADCAYSRSGEGLHRFTDPADGGVYLYSDLETFDAHRIYACFDQPDLKATFEFSVLAPADWLVLSNTAADVPGEPDGVARRWHFPPSPLMSTYITAIVAGPYYEVRSEHDGIPLGIYCRQSLAGYLDPDEIFQVTREGFDFYHGAFGTRYAFGKYDQVFVPEFKAGAMENAGCVTFLEDYVFRSRVTDFAREVRAETILHEMAHMWFGDLVTMRWWDDLWLNESFATWASVLAESEATRWVNAWTTFCQLQKSWAYQQDQLPSTHPIAADIPDIAAVEVNFDGITYAKGASVLKQLVAYVGREQFLAGVRLYFGQHAWGNATLTDLLAALEETSGRELADWSKEWLETAGVNTLRPDFVLDSDGRMTEFAVAQTAPPEHPVLRSHRIAVGLYDQTEAGLIRRRRVEVDIAGERTVLAELAGERQPDLVLVNDDDLTYAKIRLDEHSDQLGGRVHRAAARHAVLGRGLGHVPGRRAGRPPVHRHGHRGRPHDHRDRGAADHDPAGLRGGAPVHRPGLAARRDRRLHGPRAAPPGRAGPARVGPAAGLPAGVRGRGHRAGRSGPADRPAERVRPPGRPGGGHRAALAAAAAAGQPGCGGPGRDRRGTGPGRDRRG
jgi:aminopeptidase N